jgi:hypothetical protein
MTMPRLPALILPAALLTTLSAQAQGWRYDLTVYGWLSATDGTMGAHGVNAKVSNSFRDTIRDSDTVLSFMGRVEARRERLGLFLDLMYSRLGYDEVPVRSAVANASSTLFIMEFGGAWQLAAGPPDGRTTWALDTLGGGRWTRTRNEIAFNGGGPSADSTVDWVDPFVGLRLRGRLGERWEYTLRGDIGGGFGGTRFAWQTIGTLGYRFEMFGLESAALVGYRALSQDYESAKQVWDVTLHGPLIGLNIRF